MLRTFIAALGTETNTFSALPAGRETFEETMLFDGDATAHPPRLFSEPLHVWRRMTEQQQGSVHESIAAFAEPAGKVPQSVYESLRDRILDDLRRAMPVDVVLLSMHGAMVSTGCDDCEGDLLARVRALVGPEVVIGGELDLHCHLTRAMVEHADVLVTFKEYPHVDASARAEEVFRICRHVLESGQRPVTATFDCRMVSMWHTPEQPMRGFVERMQALEGRDGVLSVSFAHGFPWGDVADVGARMMVVMDGAQPDARERGEALAARLGRELFALREQTSRAMLTIDEALDRAVAAAKGPVVLADVADNAGGGAPGDSTFALRRVLERGIEGVASALYWDPVAVRLCREAGVGASLALRVGGKLGPASGDPLDLEVEVVSMVPELLQPFGGALQPAGAAVRVRTAGSVDLVLSSQRTQVFHPDVFRVLGIDVAAKRVLLVKSSQHFHAGFAPLAEEIYYVNGPGAIPRSFSDIRYTRRDGNYWPRAADPWSA
jgi:microcystin degradation protein MlrC